MGYFHLSNYFWGQIGDIYLHKKIHLPYLNSCLSGIRL